MVYDDLGHLLAITDALENPTTYEYDGNLLITTTDAMEGVVLEHLGGRAAGAERGPRRDHDLRSTTRSGRSP